MHRGSAEGRRPALLSGEVCEPILVTALPQRPNGLLPVLLGEAAELRSSRQVEERLLHSGHPARHQFGLKSLKIERAWHILAFGAGLEL